VKVSLLPKTPLATWLLAALAWGAACAVAWLALPVRPRAEWALPETGVVVGFGPGGETLLTYPTESDHSNWPCGPLTIRDAATGRDVGSVSLASTEINSFALSPDGQWCAAGWSFGRPAPLRLVDVAARRVVATLPVGDGAFDSTFACAFAPDGLLAYPSVWQGLPCVTLWDCAAGRERGVLRDVRFPAAFSPDARLLAAAGASDRHSVAVWRLDDLRRVAAVACSPGCIPQEVGFGGGTRLVVAMYPFGRPVGSNRFLDLHCYGLSGGVVSDQLDVPMTLGLFALVDGGRTLTAVVRGRRGYDLTWRDVDAGNEAVQPLGFDGLDRASGLASPDGRTVFVSGVRESRLMAMANRYCLPRWFDIRDRRPVTRLWDAASRRYLGELPVKAAATARWSPDGTQLATPDEDRLRVRVWDVPPRRPLAWLVSFAALQALLLIALARRRVRRLSRESVGPAP
jgi:hypothetical protein